MAQACQGSECLPARATAPCSCSRRAPTASWGAFNTRSPLRLAPPRGQRRGQAGQVLSAAAVEEASPARELPSMGPDLWNTTYYPKGADADPNTKAWYLIDAEGQTLGRLACLAANHIRGKLVPGYQPSMDMGSYVVVVNAEKVAVTGDKANQKMYRRHTGRPGSMKEEAFRHLQARLPERIVEQAIKGMLPSGRLGKRLFTHLKVYKGPAHPHQAQRPTDITAHINQKPGALVSPPAH